MARTRRLIASRFFKKVQAEWSDYELASTQAGNLIKEILLDSHALIHVVTARCKDRASLWLKLCEKKYSQPEQDLTDLVAARIITYYKDHVQIVSRALSKALEIDRSRSADKNEEIESDKFGYTSVHLIART